MKRRTWLQYTLGLAAAATGGGLSWWHQQQRQAQAQLEDALWSQTFERPDGSELLMNSLRGRPLLLNFWATWCPPCIQEMPLLNHFHNQQAPDGWRVLGLAVDHLEPVRRLLARTPVNFDIGVLGFGGLDLALAWGNTTRQLPFSVALNKTGQLLERKLGAFKEADLAKLAEPADRLNRP